SKMLAAAQEEAMRMRNGGRSVGVFFRLAAAALLVLAGANTGRAQPPPPPAPPPPAPPATPAERPSPSQAFPDGWLPSGPAAPEAGIPPGAPAPEGGIPTTAAKPGPVDVHPEVHAPSSAYGVPGLTPRQPQGGPGEPEFYHPVSDPMPDYYYRPGYYDTPGIGARPLAEYAPPGYEPRETDEGQAPGTPELT